MRHRQQCMRISSTSQESPFAGFPRIIVLVGVTPVEISMLQGGDEFPVISWSRNVQGEGNIAFLGYIAEIILAEISSK